ncbi:MAG: cell wall-binding repeat-containing protein [Coriobacteriia bacterium]|nr:cell wall-binding repeat-containing protein [Coriobacteriia bacterium]
MKLVLALALALPSLAIAPQPADASSATTRVSVSSAGAQTDGGESYHSSISSTGRYVVFESYASNLVAGGTNGRRHIFWHDRHTGATELISVSGNGEQANGNSFEPSVSADGRYVAFQSGASNLVANDSNATIDVFVRDRQAGTTVRASVASGTPGAQANAVSANPAISANGRFVAFDSSATNLVSGDSNARNDVFVRDLQTNTTTRVSLAHNSTTQATGGGSRNPSISADGRYVAFESMATNLVAVATNGFTHIYVRDRTANSTVRMSVTGSTTQANSDSQNPAISGNGLVVAFESYATNLSGTNVNAPVDVYVRAGTSTTRVNRATGASGALGNGVSKRPSLSFDGRYVAFDASSTNIVPGDTNGRDDVFVRDRTAHVTYRVSLSSAGTQGNGSSWRASISDNGMTTAFDSLATNLVGGDTNGASDVFVREGLTAPTVPAGSITINGGASATNAASVTVAHTVDWGTSSAGHVRHSLDDGSTWTSWEAYAPTKVVTLLGGQGTKTVRAEFRDAAGAVSTGIIQASIILDTSPPTGSIAVNGGATYTNSTAVTVSHSVNFAISGAHTTQAMQFSVDGGSTWSEWEPYQITKALSLAGGDGTKTVTARFRDAAGNVATLTDSIVLDTAYPTGAIVLESGAAATKNTQVIAAHTVTWGLSGAGRMRHSTNNGSTWTAWGTYAPTVSVTLPGGDGTKSVRVQFEDAAGNVSTALISDSIVLDTTAPTGSILINDGATHTASTSVTVTSDVRWGASGAHTTQAMRYHNGTAWSEWQPYAAVTALSFPGGNGTKTVKAEFRDAAGNVSLADSITDSIELDTSEPAVVGLTATPHGSAGSWNASRDPVFTWGASTAVEGYSHTWSQNAPVTPGTGSADPAATFSISGVSDGTWFFSVRAQSAAGVWGPPTSLMVRIDGTPPDGSIQIDEGAAATNSRNVSITQEVDFTISGPHGTEAMRFHDGLTWGAWEPFGATKSLQLAVGDGEKTVRAQFKDAAGNTIERQSTITLDTTRPTGSVVIEGGAQFTNKISVAVVHSVTWGVSGVGQMRHSVDGGSSWVGGDDGWVAYSQSREVDLPPGDGTRTVMAEFRDAAGNVSLAGTITGMIIRDATPPSGSISINGGAQYATSTVVTVTNSVNFAIAEAHQTEAMQFSLDGGTTWSGWEGYKTSKGLTLPAGNGTKTVRARFKDAAGNVATLSASIYLDTTTPTKPAVSLERDAWGKVTVKWNGVSDTGSGVASYRVYNGATPISGVLSASARSFTASTLAPGVTASLKVRATDKAGNYRDSDTKSIAPHIALAGTTRYHTAIDTARLAFPTGASTVILATGENFPDALAAAPLAGILDAPILLVPTKLSTASRISGLDATLAYAKSELKASKVIVLGGDIAITPAVYSRIVARFGSSNITRYAGETRYDTANMIIARALSEMQKASKPFSGTAFLATGANFPDALAAAPISASNGWPVFLTKGTSFTTATKTAMQNAKVKKVVVLGGDLAIDKKTYAQVAATFGSSNVTRIQGATRYDTAAKIATLAVAGTITETSRIGVSVKTKHTWDRVGITTGTNFPDALAGGMLQAKPFGTRGSSVTLLTNPTKLSAATEATLKLRKGPIDVVTFYGGELALNQAVRTSVLNALQ